MDVWKIEKDVCRCCHSEGSFKSLCFPCIDDQGQHEVYLDLLQQSFDIVICPVNSTLSNNAFNICEDCIVRLRDASIFKKQVLLCEEKFKQMYTNNLIIAAHTDVKVECVDDDVLEESDVLYIDESADMRYSDEDDDLPLKTCEVTQKKGKKRGKNKKESKSQSKEDDNALLCSKGQKNAKEQTESYFVKTEEKYQCKHCERAFASQPLVSQHYRFVHLKKRPRERKCPDCDVKIPSYLKAYHMEEAHGVPAPSCGACGKRFRFPSHVLRHQKKVHMLERTIVCALCEKSFFDTVSLKAHMSLHSEKKKYKCDTCQREFRWENNLRDHLKIHTGERRYVCAVCSKAFVQKSSLKRHVCRNHPGLSL